MGIIKNVNNCYFRETVVKTKNGSINLPPKIGVC